MHRIENDICMTLDTDSLLSLQNELSSARKKISGGAAAGRTEYCVSAAELYCRAGKPLRAGAMLHRCDQGALSSAQRIRLDRVRDAVRAASAPAHPRCSLNMIVKNEAANIGQALDSVDLLMDEIVIVDTGSIDATVEKAALYGVIIVVDPWKNDFSRARNRALEESTGEWIFWMDADDRLEFSSWQGLSSLWRESPPQAVACCIINECEQGEPIAFMQVRLFPRRDHLRFEQPIHEQIMYSAVRNNIPFSWHPELCIRHLGYRNPALNREKALRNKDMILAALLNNGDDPVLQFSLGDVCMLLNEVEEAKALYQKVASNTQIRAINPDLYLQAHVYLGQIHLKEKDIANAVKTFEYVIECDETRIEAHFHLGRIKLMEDKKREAAHNFLKCVTINPPLRMTASNNVRVKLEALFCLTDILLEWKHFAQAEELLSAVIRHYPNVPQFHMQYGKILLAINKLVEAARAFTKSITLSPERNDESYRGMAEIYRRVGDGKTAEEYLCKCTARERREPEAAAVQGRETGITV